MFYSGVGDKNFMKLPDPLTKRSLLYGVKATTPEQLSAIAKGFQEAGQLNDAADFFSKAKENQALEKLIGLAIEEGDTFLVLKLFKLLAKEADSQSLVRCAQRAESLSKPRHAILAYERLGEDEKVASLRETIKDDLDIKSAVEADVFIPNVVEEIGEE
ncbi:hypothetical protein GW915_03695 [bacterium]|nr:hypothetical protein [bacterium]